MKPWNSFWCVVALFVVCEAVLTYHGIDTFFWRFRTPEEKAIQQKLAGNCTP